MNIDILILLLIFQNMPYLLFLGDNVDEECEEIDSSFLF